MAAVNLRKLKREHLKRISRRLVISTSILLARVQNLLNTRKHYHPFFALKLWCFSLDINLVGLNLWMWAGGFLSLFLAINDVIQLYVVTIHIFH